MTNKNTNTRTLEPRAYYVGALNAFTTSKDEAEKMGKQFPVESLYPAAAYEALKAENEAQEKRINEQDLLIKILMSAAGLLGSAEQAKKIAELEAHVTKLGAGSRQHLYKAFARRYKEILSLRKENESLRKQVENHKEWHMLRDEMRKALEAQMNGDSK